jgi:thioredoxin reductase
LSSSYDFPPLQCDVAIIGGGPSGLAAATELKNMGVASVVVLEREPQAGGIPRHCGHSPFGMREFKRILSGPRYAERLVARANDARITLCLNTTVVSLSHGGKLQLTTPLGLHEMNATRIIICTGVRETPRAARLISGQRPMGILTTGALQSIVYIQGNQPFKHPVIVGSELVAFSALLSCRHAKIRPLAMLEQNPQISAQWGSQWLARIVGVPVHLNTELLDIQGKQSVTGVMVRDGSGNTRSISCDGIIFSGQFVAESSLMRSSHLEIDAQTGNPIIDQFGRCSDPIYFATGNVTHPVETAGYCWRDGVRVARQVYASLSGLLGDARRRIPVLVTSPEIKYAVPQLLSLLKENTAHSDLEKIQLKFTRPCKGRLIIRIQGNELYAKSVSALPERRIEIPLPEISRNSPPSSVEVRFEAEQNS